MPSSRSAALGSEVLTCLRFYTRLPLPAFPWEAALPFAPCLRWAPVAGLAVGGIGAAVLLGAAALGLPPLAGAALALLATVLGSGGLHEDGLADCADGFGGGHTRERKLAIMRDSRLGTFGALAIGFSLLLRAAALQGLSERGGAGLAAAGLVAGAAVSRGFGLLPLATLPPARIDGLGAGAGRLPGAAFLQAVGMSAALGAALPLAAGAGIARVLVALALAGVAALGTARLARRHIGGVTGDVAGACQQLCEGAVLVGLLLGPV